MEKTKVRFPWLYDILVLIVLAAAAFLRLTGSDWGGLEHQHPDELTVTSVTYDLGLIGNQSTQLGPAPSIQSEPWRAAYPQTFTDCSDWGGYFNTACSPLNPQNRGHNAFVYGTLPVFIVRYLAEWSGQMGGLKLFGRQMSAVADLITILLLYLSANRLYGRRVALLAATFSSLAVMQIQQSHFYTTDTFAVTFMTLAVYLAVEIVASPEQSEDESEGMPKRSTFWRTILKDRQVWLSLLFGLAYGMAVASKGNAYPLALLLPLAFVIRYLKRGQVLSHRQTVLVITALVVGGFFAILSFRIFQPYAFDGLGLNRLWLDKVQEQRLQATPLSDLPWNLQWARRTHLYSFENLTLWGLGLPLGILAWAGFLWMGWRSLKGEWRLHLLIWGWTAGYFIWQSLQYNPTMRYQLPIYPFLALMAAWIVIEGAAAWKRLHGKVGFWRNPGFWLKVVGVVVLALTAGWAYAFSTIYTRDEPRVAASKWIYQNIPSAVTLQMTLVDGSSSQQPLPAMPGIAIQPGSPYQVAFTPPQDGLLTSILLAHVVDQSSSGVVDLTVRIANGPDPVSEQVLASAGLSADYAASEDARGDPVSLTFTEPLPVKVGQTYYLALETSAGELALSGSTVVNETDYDWSLPFRIDGYDGFGGLYRGDLNLQIYWDDNEDKLARFLTSLNEGDYIFIPTNHQYAQTTRIPERYPLTTAYYRMLIGCPEEEDIITCYRQAEPGMYAGQLGFELVAVFTDYPTLGSLVINDQAAEEAFTFYDHPKVLIFRKTAAYDPIRVAALLSSVDLSQAVHLLPGQADDYKDLMLSEDDLAIQQAGGTWSELFDREALLNRFPGLGLATWYLLILAVGLVAYPLVRAALPGLADGGYPFGRVLGLLLWAWLVWWAGSNGIPFNKVTIGICLALVAGLGLWQGWRQRAALREEWGRRWKFYLLLEIIFLLFFVLDLLIRLGNPDLWHPSKGGERPMNFAQFNAVLKSTTFPPYDAWYAGGYINYYYFGDVIIGTPVKFLGIVPSVAFNYVLPTLFAVLVTAAFSLGYNILKPRLEATVKWSLKKESWSLLAGSATATAVVLLGNLGVVRLFIQGFQRHGIPDDLLNEAYLLQNTWWNVLEEANLLEKAWWTLKGFVLTLAGLPLPYGPGDWYWFASRIFAYPHDTFYEFPAFTFLYSDLHAHMIAYMLTVLVVAWVISLLHTRAQWKSRLDLILGFFVGALVVGSIKPTNFWDFYTYFALANITLFYALARYARVEHFLPRLPEWLRRLCLAGVGVAVLSALALLFFQPFTHSFAQAYNTIDLWKGMRTPLITYLVQWSPLLFFIVAWMAWETRQWLAQTPVSALRRLQPYQSLILGGLVMLVFILVFQQVWVRLPTQTPPWKEMTSLWLALPLAAWAGVLLLFRTTLTDMGRLVLFMIGTGLLLTMVVELGVIGGDVGRMNTLYKFGIQSWVLLAIGAAAGFVWVLMEMRAWLLAWRILWQAGATLMVLGASLFLLVAGVSKIRDRWMPEIPHTLDSMEYMKYARYSEFGRDFTTDEDYEAIVWMQENIEGSPVIVEAAPAGVQYTWLSRYSIYTGLPAVVGWQWHEQQQRVYFSSQVIQRGIAVDQFFTTIDLGSALAFLEKYDVRYIIVGQLELGKYTPLDPLVPNGLAKFELYDGIYWQEVFRTGETVIYEVKSELLTGIHLPMPKIEAVVDGRMP